MKTKSPPNIFKKRFKHPQIFPSIDCEENSENSFEMPKNPGLKLFTKIRSSKIHSGDDKEQRPLTATLEKPAILDLKLISKIDMSTIRKEFLNITNLCRVPIAVKVKKKKPVVVCRPLSICAPEIASRKVRKLETSSDESWEDEESMKSAKREEITKMKLKNIPRKSIKTVPKTRVELSDKNNNKSLELSKKELLVAQVEVVKEPEVKKKLSKTAKVPEPCKTCGRPNQPERFHSHPETTLKPLKKIEVAVKIPVKNSVQKPVAIKYRSKQLSIKKPLPIRKPSLPAQVLEHSPPATAQNGNMETKPSSRVGSAKRTLTCYICGREFGTASLPLHEPKCVEKWERENKNLPVHLRRSRPVKPDPNCPIDEWNQKALEVFKSKLLPCLNCGRTFNPESLIIHQRSCKENQNTNSKVEVHSSLSSLVGKSSTPKSPLNFECSACGKKFSSHSIKIHERQCLKKKEMDPAGSTRENRTTNFKSAAKSKEDILSPKSPHNGSRPSSERKPQIFPCYLCGKMFSIASIHIHEPQCLKMWRMENDKLSLNRRRKEPIKPDIKYSHDGKIDFGATTEDCWQSHLSQLVPCRICSRTFNPDRVDIHEKNCKG